MSTARFAFLINFLSNFAYTPAVLVYPIDRESRNLYSDPGSKLHRATIISYTPRCKSDSMSISAVQNMEV